MDYSSSEDDELLDDCMEPEEDIKTLTVHHQMGEDTGSLQFSHHVGNHMTALENSIGNELISPEQDVKNNGPYLGMELESDCAARAFYNAYALRTGFGIRVARSRSERRKGVEVLVMKRFVCLKEGHHKKKVSELSNKKKRKRLSIRDGCPAMMEVVRRGPDKWVVTKLVLEHTHVVVSPERAREMHLSQLSGKDREHQDYLKELRKEVFGEEDVQVLLEYFNKMQAENSGFFYAMQVDSRNCMTNVVWADARARMSYDYFGDAVTFDTTYKKNKNMMPFAVFTGLNHHGQTVVFGCALIIDKTEASFSWLFETWLTAMLGKYPVSLTTDHSKAITPAVAKVFPQTCHRLCRWRILSRCKKNMSDIYSRHPTLHDELKACVNESGTIEIFEGYWHSIMEKYNLTENTWLQSLYSLRQKWVPAYIIGSFFGELCPSYKLETLNRFHRNNLLTRSSLQMFIKRFDQQMDVWYEKESHDDFKELHSQQLLKTDSPMEKHSANVYTRYVFQKFQVELIEALGHYTVKVQDGPTSKYSVGRNGDTHNRHVVVFNASERKACCSCYKFEVSGILCRHALAVLLVNSVMLLPENFLMKRWTKKAKSGLTRNEDEHDIQIHSQHSPILRYNDLLRDVMKCAERGATSTDTYKVAKDMLRKAFAQITGFEENLSKVGLVPMDKV